MITPRMKRLIMMAVGLLSLAGTATAQTYNVTVTNITASQVFTPLLFVSHIHDMQLFQVGEAASGELEQVAEAGDTMPLRMALEATGMTADIQALMEPLPPGKSVTVPVITTEDMSHISIVGMLVPTNDAFVALNSARVPETSETVRVPAYDAGTEANDENCMHIPGPPTVCTGEGFNESRDGAEGFVHIHRGIHGIMDLNTSVYDWRNPVAQITIELAQ
jgi:hypothetical protein